MSLVIERQPLQVSGLNLIDPRQRARAGLPIAEVVAPLSPLSPIPTFRMRQEASLRRMNVIPNLAPNSIAGYNDQSALFPIFIRNTPIGIVQELGNNGSTVVIGEAEQLPDGKFTPMHIMPVTFQAVRGLYTAALSPYVDNGIHLTAFDLGSEQPPTIADLPPHILTAKFETNARMLSAMLEQSDSAVWGNNDSPFSLEGRNLQSVLWPHDHIFEVNGVRLDNILLYRNNHRQPDNGLTEEFGQMVTPLVQDAIGEDFLQGALVNPDKMGFTLVTDFTPMDMANPAFLETFLLPLYRVIHEQVSNLHDKLHIHPYEKVVTMVNKFHEQGFMTDQDKIDYNNLFTLKPPPENMSHFERELRELHERGEAKAPMGFCVGAFITKEGKTLFAVSPVFRNDIPFGPAELFGIQVTRPEEVVDNAERMVEERIVYEALRDKILV